MQLEVSRDQEIANLKSDAQIFMRMRDAAEQELQVCEIVLHNPEAAKENDHYKQVISKSILGQSLRSFKRRSDETEAAVKSLKEQLDTALEISKRYREERNHYRDLYYGRKKE